MRELIYLSERKLSGFRQEPRRGFRVREIGVPGLGQVGVEPRGDSHLDDVIDHLGGIARWFEEDGLAPGEWAHFEATMSYLVLESPGGAAVLLFADEPGGRRLYLHGSPDHLVGTAPGTRLPTPSVSLGPVLSRTLAAHVRDPGGRPPLGRLLGQVEDPFDPELAARMTGFARVTSVGDGGVVASPLFVAYARQ
jgi:uncharacterized protein DUF7019